MELSVLRGIHIRELEAQNKSAETVRFYKQAYKELEGFFGEGHEVLEDLNKIRKHHILSVTEAMRQRGLTPGGQHAMLRGLRAIFNWAAEGEYLDVNPMTKVKLPSLPKKLMPAVQPDMAQRALRLTDHDGKFKARNRAILAVMYDTGLRLSEVAALELGDIDLRNGVLRVQKGKGDKERWVPFGSDVVRSLNKYLRTRRPMTEGEQALWLNHHGKPFTKWGVIQLLEGYADQLKVDRSELAPHAWRRGFAVQYLRNGGDLFALQQLLGHTNLEMTRKYVQYLNGDLKRAHTLISPMDRLRKEK